MRLLSLSISTGAGQKKRGEKNRHFDAGSLAIRLVGEGRVWRKKKGQH